MAQDQGTYFQPWFLEWALGAAWAAGLAVTGFLTKLASRVAVLENNFDVHEAAIERRHRENLVAWSRLEEQIERLTKRIDTLVDRTNRD